MADFDWSNEELDAVNRALRDHADCSPGHMLPDLDFGADLALDALEPFIAERERAAAAKALRKAADGIEHPDGPFGIGAEGQDAADWLRVLADQIEGGW